MGMKIWRVSPSFSFEIKFGSIAPHQSRDEAVSFITLSQLTLFDLIIALTPPQFQRAHFATTK